jgi:hypothetical protein
MSLAATLSLAAGAFMFGMLLGVYLCGCEP